MQLIEGMVITWRTMPTTYTMEQMYEYIIRFRLRLRFSQAKTEALVGILNKCLSEVKFSKSAIRLNTITAQRQN